jgi:hypothetical protein
MIRRCLNKSYQPKLLTTQNYSAATCQRRRKAICEACGPPQPRQNFSEIVEIIRNAKWGVVTHDVQIVHGPVEQVAAVVLVGSMILDAIIATQRGLPPPPTPAASPQIHTRRA